MADQPRNVLLYQGQLRLWVSRTAGEQLGVTQGYIAKAIRSHLFRLVLGADPTDTRHVRYPAAYIRALLEYLADPNHPNALLQGAPEFATTDTAAQLMGKERKLFEEGVDAASIDGISIGTPMVQKLLRVGEGMVQSWLPPLKPGESTTPRMMAVAALGQFVHWLPPEGTPPAPEA